ncbi:MAG TPA: glycosyltransferase [Candidatus Latescibacteria bacterium]|nr:glycosyltransferase [Candidatus Latescibacterota bacterium]
MKISGFTFVRNAIKLYYPIVESITSILPICDEFIVAAGDSDDETTEIIRSIGSPKIKIIETVWDPKYFVGGAINAQQTNLALDHCSGDWAFYLQADEVVHERYLPVIKSKLEHYLDVPEVEGFLFAYKHFFGDYEHYQTAHGWYKYEVRIIRNGLGIRSYRSAKGFRKADGSKLRVVPVGAEIYHYGWVRPPTKMKQKQIALDSLHHSPEWVRRRHPDPTAEFDYGSLERLAKFMDTHPKVMQDRIARMDWKVSVERSPGVSNQRSRTKSRHRHNRIRVRLLSSLEKVLRTPLFERRNYILLKKFSCRS